MLIPLASALAAGRDPVPAVAAEELGVKLDRAEAGKRFLCERGGGPVRLE